MGDRAKDQLVRLLESHVFDPVLTTRPTGRSETDRAKLEHVQKATRAEIARLRDYRSAKDALVNFRRDLGSAPARRVHVELHALGLPTINDFRDEFERRAETLGVAD